MSPRRLSEGFGDWIVGRRFPSDDDFAVGEVDQDFPFLIFWRVLWREGLAVSFDARLSCNREVRFPFGKFGKCSVGMEVEGT